MARIFASTAEKPTPREGKRYVLSNRSALVREQGEGGRKRN